MYTLTFYSFKGGVGRTMALVNVGLALAKSGRRVLLVDFDLEAPGIDTFEILRPPQPTAGIVDFVTQYRTFGASPDVRDFVYQPSDPRLEGRVWVMPTGGQRPGYPERLNAIDWQRLYAEESGYLLFEDTKQQWSRELAVDYVLVDSRTGHTDAGGICTRQLPDAVCLLFFPNEQNRRGLEVVARDIQRESRESERTIETYLVASNVPDLDDEDSILRERLDAFRHALGKSPQAIIHHYDSLALLQQSVFTLERPQTKLAREYQGLARIVTSKNLADPWVASEFFDTFRRGPFSAGLEEVESTLDTIERWHSGHGPILLQLARANRVIGRTAKADLLAKAAEGLGYPSEDRILERAGELYSSGAVADARKMILRGLTVPSTHPIALRRLLGIAVKSDVDFLATALAQLQGTRLEDAEKIFVASELGERREALPALGEFLALLPSTAQARIALSLCLIGQRRFGEAMELILRPRRRFEDLSIADAFNYAMGVWGEKKAIPVELFQRVVALDRDVPGRASEANYRQSLAIAAWAAGLADEARMFAAESRKAVGDERYFSAWRYLLVDRDNFLEDLDSLDSMIETGEGTLTILRPFDA